MHIGVLFTLNSSYKIPLAFDGGENGLVKSDYQNKILWQNKQAWIDPSNCRVFMHIIVINY